MIPSKYTINNLKKYYNLLLSQDSHLDSLLECAKAILEVSKKDCKSISGYLFKIGITVDGLSLSNELQESANAFIDNLASVLEISRLDLFKQELGKGFFLN